MLCHQSLLALGSAAERVQQAQSLAAQRRAVAHFCTEFRIMESVVWVGGGC